MMVNQQKKVNYISILRMKIGGHIWMVFLYTPIREDEAIWVERAFEERSSMW